LETILRDKNQSLREQGRQQLSRYHAADCSSRKGEFKGWTVKEQVEFAKRLIAIFKKHFVNVIAYSMPLDEFVRVFPECKDDPVLVQPEMEKRRSPLVSIPPFGRGFSRHGVYRPMTFFRQRAAREKDIPRC
jgi:hypothetical protein